MDWNNYFLSRSNQNFNFVPGGYPPVNNAAMYQSSDQNWQYYRAFNQNFLPETSSTLNDISATVPTTYGANFVPLSRNMSENSVRSSMEVAFVEGGSVGPNDKSHPQADALSSILLASSLTPTAGEFVPRSKTVKQISSDNSSSLKDSQIVAPTVSSDSQQQISELNSVSEMKSFPVSADFGGAERKYSESEQFSSNIVNSSIVDSQVKANSNSSENSSNSSVINTALCRSRSIDNNKSSDKNNKFSDTFACDQSTTGYVNTKSKSDTHCNSGETKVVPPNVTPSSRGQSAPLRRGSGRILQNRVNENPRSSNMGDSKSLGRHNLLSQASTFYSTSYTEGRSSSDKGNGSQISNNEQSFPSDTNFGRKSRDQSVKYNDNGKAFFNKNGRKVCNRLAEGGANTFFKERENMNEKTLSQNSVYQREQNGKFDRRENTVRKDKFNRFDRTDRDERLCRGDRKDRSFFQDRSEGQNSSEKQDKDSDRLDRGGDRLDWSGGRQLGGNDQDKGDRQERQDRGDRQERQDRGDRQERQDRGDRQERQDRGDRQERQDRGDRQERQDRGDRQERQDRGDRKDRQERGNRQERQERGNWQDRQDRGDRKDRQDRINWVMGQEKNDSQDRDFRQGRQEKNDRQDRGNWFDKSNRIDRGYQRGDLSNSDNRSEKVDTQPRHRSFREDKFERDVWPDRGNRYDRLDRGDRFDGNNWSGGSEKLVRGTKMDRGDRAGKGDRDEKREGEYKVEKAFWNDRTDQMFKNDGGKQKTFFNSRFKNYDSSPSRREEWSDCGTHFYKGQRYTSNFHLHSESGAQKDEVNEEYQNSSESNRASPESESQKYSGKVECPAANRTSIAFEKDRNLVSVKNSNLQVTSNWMKNLGQGQFSNGDDDASQRERLSDQLSRGALECLVCCERVRQHDAVWSCSNCYHVLHLRCIKKWAKSSKVESGWRCPACQNVSSKVPQDYRCFCGKMRDPEWNRQDLPHTCGEMCGRARKSRSLELGTCTHRCTLLCHPGPCPVCVAQVSRSCGCGKTSQIVSCGNSQPLLCAASCDKLLNCGLHHCMKTCHWGPCGDCEEIVKQVCYCSKVSREVKCTVETSMARHFSCEAVCGKVLECENHFCPLVCHEGSCSQCDLMPERVSHCPCGKTALDEDCQRKSCLDPIPTCGQKCGKQLSCGQPGKYHECQAECHTGPCPQCPLTTFVKCRCGHMDREIECKDLKTKADDARCEKRCSKKRVCGKHKCNQACCIDVDHQCPLPCNHTLSCGLHKCEELCHRGHCPPCWRTSFEELYCECGANVIYPPVPCGTRRPACSNPCTRQHPCDHQALHQCHSEPSCPPCTVLMERYCYGKHELRKAVPCHRTEFSCGMPCGLPLPCGQHTCILPCHKGPCIRESQPICTQPCKAIRSICGHPCAAPCHEGDCPETPCKETVRVTCECGHRSTTRPCYDQTKEYRRVLTTQLATKMQDVQQGLSVDITDLSAARAMSLKTLDCNDECKIIERNRRLAIGLQIRNPDLSSKLQPRYSDFMRQWGKKDPFFAGMVHEKLTELVQLAKQSKQKSRSYSFSSMNRDKRHFIHEYCEHFGCESQAYDPEPNRNVVATAQRDRAWLPSMSLLEVLQRESGQRKVPKPVTAWAVDTKIREAQTWRSSSLTKSEDVSKSDKETSKKDSELNNDKDGKVQQKEEEEEIDYFEMTS